MSMIKVLTTRENNKRILKSQSKKSNKRITPSRRNYRVKIQTLKNDGKKSQMYILRHRKRSYSDDKRSSFKNRWTKMTLSSQSQLVYYLLAIVISLTVGALTSWFWWGRSVRDQERIERERKKEEKEQIDYWLNYASKQLDKPCTVIQEPYYVSRNNLESQLRKAIKTMCENASRTYYVIIGSRGTGKTTCLNEVIRDRKATVVVKIDEQTSPADIGFLVLESLGIRKDDIGNIRPSPFFIDVCRRYNSTHSEDPIPLVVFEISTKTTEETFIAVTKWCKWVSSDERVCGSMVNVSSALLAIALSTDRDARREYIHVGPFTVEEAYQYAKILRPDMKQEEVGNIINRLGAQPLMLGKALTCDDLEAYIQSEYIAKRSDVKRNLTRESYLNLFEALLDSEDNTLTVEEVTDIDAKLLGKIGESIRAYHVIEYDPTGYVRFSSKVAMEAAREVIRNTSDQ